MPEMEVAQNPFLWNMLHSPLYLVSAIRETGSCGQFLYKEAKTLCRFGLGGAV